MMMPRYMEKELAEKERSAQAPQTATAQPSATPRATGPVTASGKETVSRNSLKHGLCAKKFAYLEGERQAYEKHLQSYIDQFRPSGPLETDLTRTLAEQFWRLRRAHQLETALFERAIIESEEEFDPTGIASIQANAWADTQTQLQRIYLYSSRIQRAIDKTMADLKALQTERQAAHAKAQQDAILLTQLAAATGYTFDPATHFPPDAPLGGFVFSRDAIDREILRAARLDQARARFAPVAQTSWPAQQPSRAPHCEA